MRFDLGGKFMLHIIWFSLLILVALLVAYYALMLTQNFKEAKPSYLFFGAWILDESNLTDEGKRYRKKIWACWLVGLILVLLAPRIV